MIILTIRTDKPEAEVGIFDSLDELAYQKWQAHRELSDTIHTKIKATLEEAKKDWSDIRAVVLYEGPGSFTGLRIGFSVGNALAYANKIPVISADGPDWIKLGINDILTGKDEKIATPNYGSPAKTTKPRK